MGRRPWAWATARKTASGLRCHGDGLAAPRCPCGYRGPVGPAFDSPDTVLLNHHAVGHEVWQCHFRFGISRRGQQAQGHQPHQQSFSLHRNIHIYSLKQLSILSLGYWDGQPPKRCRHTAGNVTLSDWPRQRYPFIFSGVANKSSKNNIFVPTCTNTHTYGTNREP